MRTAIYVRVSTQEQAKEGYSIGEQTERLTKFCEAQGWTIINVYTDAGYSGGNTDRPALQQLIHDVKRHCVDKVLVYKLDRLSRSQRDTLDLIENIFLKNDCDFESMTEKLDTNTATGRAMLGILASFAQLEREMIKDRMSLGIEARVKEGKWRGGSKVPFGYRYEDDTLVIHPYEAMIVREIYDMYTSGKHEYAIGNQLLKEGHVLHSGKADQRSIKYILQNRTYCGYLKYKNDWIKGLHEPIITDEHWELAQDIRKESNRRYKETGWKNGTSATSSNLGGLLWCSHCGARYTRQRSGSSPQNYHYNYVCYSRSKKNKLMIIDPNCHNKIYRVEELDEIIFNELRKLKLDPTYFDKICNPPSEDNTDVINSEIQSINNQISRLLDLYSTGIYDIETLNEKVTVLQNRLKVLQHELEEKNRLESKSDGHILEIIDNLDYVLDYGTLEERRSVITALIDRIDINEDDITIHWNF